MASATDGAPVVKEVDTRHHQIMMGQDVFVSALLFFRFLGHIWWYSGYFWLGRSVWGESKGMQGIETVVSMQGKYPTQCTKAFQVPLLGQH